MSFEAIIGPQFASDIAIDDVVYTEGPCAPSSKYIKIKFLNPHHAGVDCRRQAQILNKKFKNIIIVDFHGHIQNQHDKWIKMSTNKSSISAVVLEIALDIWRKYLKT
jgi:hypothetical protein